MKSSGGDDFFRKIDQKAKVGHLLFIKRHKLAIWYGYRMTSSNPSPHDINNLVPSGINFAADHVIDAEAD